MLEYYNILLYYVQRFRLVETNSTSTGVHAHTHPHPRPQTEHVQNSPHTYTSLMLMGRLQFRLDFKPQRLMSREYLMRNTGRAYFFVFFKRRVKKASERKGVL